MNTITTKDGNQIFGSGYERVDAVMPHRPFVPEVLARLFPWRNPPEGWR